MKVLIIEDDQANREMLAKLLRQSWKIEIEPLEIMECADLQCGLARAAEANATILDLWLPGSTLTEVFDAIPKFLPPVIVLTGDDEIRVRSECLRLGAAHVFIKGQAIDLIPAIFEVLQRDLARRIAARHEQTPQ